MAGVDCTIHLLALEPGKQVKEISKLLTNELGTASYIIKGRPHGWIHSPLHNNTAQLLAKDWDLFLLTDSTTHPPSQLRTVTSAHLAINVSVPRSQYESLISRIGVAPTHIPETPPLPTEWPKDGGIPSSAITTTHRTHGPGELKLDAQMSHFLSTTLPETVENKPVSLFNLFKYPAGDRGVHDAYMEGFKEKFGPAAGAGVKFMGPVKGGVQFRGELRREGKSEGEWQDANLVQYDSIWHYAYMLSTGVYQGLNVQKVKGLVDTCILCVSEVELVG